MIRTLAILALVLPLTAQASDPLLYDNGTDTRSGALVMTNERLPADDFRVESASLGSSAYRVTGAHFRSS